MKIVKEDLGLLEIRQIENLTSISFQDIYVFNNQKPYIIPGFIITYGNQNNILFLTDHDKYFQEFVKKLKEVYQKEKDDVKSNGIFGKEYIRIDPISKEVLQNGNLDKVDSIYDYYEGKDSYSSSLLFEEDHLKSYIPIFKYILERISKNLNFTINNITLSEGKNGYYYVQAKIDDKLTILPIYFEEQSSSCHFTISNILDNAIPINASIDMTNDSMVIHTYIPEVKYDDYVTFTLEDKKEKSETYLGNTLINYDIKDIVPCDKNIPSSYLLLDDEDDNIVWYQLPWQDYIGYKKEVLPLKSDIPSNTSHNLVEQQLVYVSKEQDNFYITKISSKYYQKIDNKNIISAKIILDRYNKITRGIKDDNTTLLETYFVDDCASSFYKTNLAGKYFYQIMIGNDSKTKEFIGRKDGLLDQCDLLEPKVYERKKVIK